MIAKTFFLAGVLLSGAAASAWALSARADVFVREPGDLTTERGEEQVKAADEPVEKKGAASSAPASTGVLGPSDAPADQAPIEKDSKPAKQTDERPRAYIDGDHPHWKALGQDDFENVNCDVDTWSFASGGLITCTGNPVGVIRSKKQFTNFELVLEWRHLKSAGNSGVFVWTPEASVTNLKPGQLPHGVECQVLDHGYTKQFEEQAKRPADWFTTDGDVFPVGVTTMKPFPPVAPDGNRSFPREKRSRGVGLWNHYYIRAINGEVRLWVNGAEVSGGSGCKPCTGFLCLESEGSPVEFRGLKLRETP